MQANLSLTCASPCWKFGLASGMMDRMEESNLNWEVEAWNRLALAFRDSRLAQELTQEEAAARAGISRGSLQNLERGGRRLRMATVNAMAKALRWPPSHVDDILAGRAQGAPSELIVEAVADTSGLPLLIQRELDQGPLLDAQVMHFGGESGARAIVVLRGSSDMTDEQIEEAFQAWRRLRKNVQSVADGDDS